MNVLSWGRTRILPDKNNKTNGKGEGRGGASGGTEDDRRDTASSIPRPPGRIALRRPNGGDHVREEEHDKRQRGRPTVELLAPACPRGQVEVVREDGTEDDRRAAGGSQQQHTPLLGEVHCAVRMEATLLDKNNPTKARGKVKVVRTTGQLTAASSTPSPPGRSALRRPNGGDAVIRPGHYATHNERGEDTACVQNDTHKFGTRMADGQGISSAHREYSTYHTFNMKTENRCWVG